VKGAASRRNSDLIPEDPAKLVRLYGVSLGRIVPYEDRELNSFASSAKTLHPLLARGSPCNKTTWDVGELQMSHYRLSKACRGAFRLRLAKEDGTLIHPQRGSDVHGKPHDPIKKRRRKFIDALTISLCRVATRTSFSSFTRL